MSSRYDVEAALQFLTMWDGALLGITVAYFAARSWTNYFRLSSALRRLRAAPNLRVFDLRSLPNVEEDDADGPLVVVRGVVRPKSVFDRWRMAFPLSFNERAMIAQRTHTWLYDKWTDPFGRMFGFHALLFKPMKEQQPSSLRSISIALVESNNGSNSDYVTVNLDGSAHLDLAQPSLYTFLQMLFGQRYSMTLLEEKIILPVGKEITVVGICTKRGGAVEIKSCRDLPIFLSDMTKGEIEADMASKSGTHFWCTILFGTISVAILGYAIHRMWLRWQEQSERRRQAEELQRDNSGEKRVACLVRRRRVAFAPCVNFVCCPCCAFIYRERGFSDVPYLSVEHDHHQN